MIDIGLLTSDLRQLPVTGVSYGNLRDDGARAAFKVRVSSSADEMDRFTHAQFVYLILDHTRDLGSYELYFHNIFLTSVVLNFTKRN